MIGVVKQYNNYSEDLKDSVIALNTIKDTVFTKLIEGKIHNIESSNNKVLLLMDQMSGIDYIRENNKGLQGIAARVQWGKAYNSFTIRSERHTGSKTELEKRIHQIKNEYFYPTFTLQAYFDNRVDNNLLSIAIIKTKDLYKIYQESPLLFQTRKSDNKFKFIYWNDLKGFVKKEIIK